MGRLRIWQPTAEEAAYANRPPEFSDDGCPGAWYRSTFVSSVAKYERLLTEGGFSGNVLLDRCDDRLVLEAVQFIEQERLRSRAFANERRRQKEA